MDEGKEKRTPDQDADLVSHVKKGDVDSFELLVKKYQKKAFNIAYRMIGDYEDACEIVQDAFVSAYRNIRKFEERARFSTWFYTIVVNYSKNRIKQLKTQGYHEGLSIDDPVDTDDSEIKVEPPSNEPSVLERLERKELQEKVQGCIDSLDNEFRDVIVLRDIQGFSYEEISDIMKIAEGTVKSRLFRAREALKDCLMKVMGDL